MLLAFVVGCGGGGSGGSSTAAVTAAPPPAAAAAPGPSDLTNRTSFTELTDRVSRTYSRTNVQIFDDEELFGGGVAAADYDGDGDIDLYLVGGDGFPNKLMENRGGNQFVDVAPAMGVDVTHLGSGPAFADIDGDGDLDLFVGAIADDPIFLFRRDGNGFTDITASSGISVSVKNTVSATFADYDLDGHLDLYLSHWGTGNRPDTQSLWRGQGDGTFTNVSVPAGIDVVPNVGGNATDNSFAGTFSDIDLDGDPDLLISGDFGKSTIYRNEGDGRFENITDRGVVIDDNGMGSAIGDYDGDGDMDWFVSSVYQVTGGTVTKVGNRLYQNQGNGTFTDATAAAGVADGGWGWGACMEDFDNDGDLDIFHVNGWDQDQGAYVDDRVRYFESNGNGTFTEAALQVGLESTGQGRGVACFDSDGDGDLDILITEVSLNSESVVFYRNDLNAANRFLTVRATSSGLNRHGIGARVEVTAGGLTRVREIRAGNNFTSQNPAEAHFGLYDAATADVLVRWPDGSRSALTGMATNQVLTIAQDSSNLRLNVTQGQGGGIYELGDEVPVQASAPADGYYFSHWSSSGGGRFLDASSPATLFTMPGGTVSIAANYLPGVAPADDVSVARRWNEVLLQAIRNDYARPTVHARNLFHVSAAMYDAWVAYAAVEVPWLLGRTRAGASCTYTAPAMPADPVAARAEALSHATYRLIRHRFAGSPGVSSIRRDADALMGYLGYDIDDESTDYAGGSAAALGNHIAACYVAFGLADGANEASDYGNAVYSPVNPALQPELPGNPNIVDLNRWQPLSLLEFIDQAGNPVNSEPEFLSPEWGQVVPFALSPADRSSYTRTGESFEYQVYHDPGMPPAIDGVLADNYKWSHALVAIWSSHLDPTQGRGAELIDISPASLGNIQSYPLSFVDYPAFYNTLDGGDPGTGYGLNPVTGLAYTPQLVPRGDYGRVLAEFWADGPDSETPPGHWFVVLNEVNDHPLLERRFAGTGTELGKLEWDVKAYFLLGGAMHDAAISAWGIKGWYDYIRPVSSIRAMADMGQSTDPGGSSYNVNGIPLEPGLIEVVATGDPLAGAANEHVGKVKLYAWRGPDYIADPETDVAGVGWILAENWWPYQRPSFVTPPFAGYVSGHSTYSRAAAEVLTALTGDPYFPGGMSGFVIPANEFLVFEDGPSVPMTLQWATYRDASDQCSLSRIWGGIHPPPDDIPGRLIGIEIGMDAFIRAVSYFDGTATD